MGAVFMSSDARARLFELLKTLSYREGTFTLASGKASDFFIDCKQTLLTAEGHALTGEVMRASLAQFSNVAAVAGVELGGCPIASAVSLVSFQKGHPLDALYVRKAAKDHGSKKLIEGGTRLAMGARIALLEDVATTGGSSLRAVEHLSEAGFVCAGVLALVDREEGASAAFAEKHIPFASVYKKREFFAK